MQIGHFSQQAVSVTPAPTPERAPVGEQTMEGTSTVIAPVVESEASTHAKDRRQSDTSSQQNKPESESVDHQQEAVSEKRPPTAETITPKEPNTSNQSANTESASDEGEENTSASDETRQKAEAARLEREEKMIIDQLKARDREVRNHEAAHAAVGGQYAGSPSYTFQQGPDGKKYAVGGEVSIDVSKVANDPQATLQKAEIVRAAALAPAQPSAQDRQVAAQASQMATEAKQEIARENAEKIKEAGKVEPEEETESTEVVEEAENTEETSTLAAATSQDESTEKENKEEEEPVLLNNATEKTANDRFTEVYRKISNNNIEAFLLNSIDDDNPTGGLLSQIV